MSKGSEDEYWAMVLDALRGDRRVDFFTTGGDRVTGYLIDATSAVDDPDGIPNIDVHRDGDPDMSCVGVYINEFDHVVTPDEDSAGRA